MAITFQQDRDFTITKTKPEEPKKPETQGDELQDLAEKAMEALGYPPAKKDEPKAEPAPPQQDAAVKPKKEEKPAAVAPKKAKSKAPAESPDLADRIATKLAAENEKLLDKISQGKEDKLEPDQEVEGRRDSLYRSIFTVMAEDKQYKNIVADFDSFLAKEAVYRKAWEKGHPDQPFEPEGEEHAEWYENNEPAYDEVDFRMAASKLATRMEFDLQHATLKAEQETHDAAQRGRKEAESNVAQLRSATAAKLHELIGENSVLEQDGPIADKVNEEAETLGRLIETATLLMTPGTGVALDPNNADHQRIYGIIRENEADLLALSEDHLKAFLTDAVGAKSHLLKREMVPASQFLKLSPEQRKQVWTLWAEPQLAAKLLQVEVSDGLLTWMAKITGAIKPKSDATAPAQSGSPAPPSGQQKAAPAPSPTAAKTAPPSVPPGADRVSPEEGASSKVDNFASTVVKSLWS